MFLSLDDYITIFPDPSGVEVAADLMPSGVPGSTIMTRVNRLRFTRGRLPGNMGRSNSVTDQLQLRYWGSVSTSLAKTTCKGKT